MFLYRVLALADGGAYQGLRIATTQSPLGAVVIPGGICFATLLSMRFSYFVVFVLMLSLIGVRWYQTTKYICPVPVEYRLGVIDESFSITEAEAKQRITQAEAVWESQAEKELFVYNDRADFVINFVFDDRQATADAQTADRARLDAVATQNKAFQSQISELQSAYEARQAAFTAQKDVYDTQLQSYDERVTQVNDRGGASPSVFTELEAEREALAQQSIELQMQADALNNLATQLNELNAQGNRLIETYNQEVRAYNAAYGEAHEFTQGDYRGGEINIYKFSDEFELVAVLAHEFGHALGIDHVEQPGSLMYYLLDDELDSLPVLDESDVTAYQAECSDQGFGARVRSIIRDIL